MSKATPRQQAAYALYWDLDPADLKPAVQAEYRLLKQERLTDPAVGHERVRPEFRPREVFRAERALVVSVWLSLAIFFGIGIAGLLSHDGSGVAMGIVILVIILYFSAVVATSRVVVTLQGLVRWRYLRPRLISWSSVRSFEVGDSAIRGPLSPGNVLLVRADSGEIVTSIAGDRSFVEDAAEELRYWQRRVQQVHRRQPQG
jgi:hypothetical protein